MEYEAVLDQLSDAMIMTSQDGVVRYTNRAFSDLLGWQAADLVGRSVVDLVPVRHRIDRGQGIGAYFAAFDEEGSLNPIHRVLLRSDGTEADVEVRLSVVTRGGEALLVGLVRDAREYLSLARTVSASRYLRASLDATAALQVADHPDEAMAGLLHALCDQLDWDVAVLWKRDDTGQLNAVDVWHAADVPAEAIEGLSRRLRLGPGEGLPGKVLLTGGPRVVPDVTASETYLRVEAARQAGLVTGVGFPLVSEDQVLGVIEFFSRRLRIVDDELMATLEAIGKQLGAYIARVSSQAAIRELAETLQASLLPPTLPEVRGLELDALYRAGTENVSVGGDVYDVFRVGRHAWALLIADVCGKGAAAAAVTALARHTVRATALENPSPTHVARALNRALLEGGDRPFLTAVFALLRRTDAGVEPGGSARTWSWNVEFVCAGHPLPVLVGERGPRLVGSPGTLLGVTPHPVFAPVGLDLAPGEALVLYTDGVTEARNAAHELFGEARLLGALKETDGTAAGAVRQVAEAVQAHVGDVADGDDVAILAVAVRTDHADVGPPPK
jgi:phosphoserine phosphatase RsbU/P